MLRPAAAYAHVCTRVRPRSIALSRSSSSRSRAAHSFHSLTLSLARRPYTIIRSRARTVCGHTPTPVAHTFNPTKPRTRHPLRSSMHAHRDIVSSSKTNRPQGVVGGRISENFVYGTGLVEIVVAITVNAAILLLLPASVRVTRKKGTKLVIIPVEAGAADRCKLSAYGE